MHTEAPSSGFISEILKDEMIHKEKMKNKKNKSLLEKETQFLETSLENEKNHENDINKNQLLEIEQKENYENKNSELSFMNEEDKLYKILNIPPQYYIFKNVPDILIPKFDNVKTLYFGAKLINTQQMKSNMVSQPIKVHKLFIALLIEPPVYEDILKAHKASVAESSFAFNLEEECYYRWHNNIPLDKEYFNYVSLCENFGISLHMNYNPQKLIVALENVKEY